MITAIKYGKKEDVISTELDDDSSMIFFKPIKAPDIFPASYAALPKKIAVKTIAVNK